MTSDNNIVDVMRLRDWLDRGEPVFILDIRPTSQWKEWRIPGSHHLDAYQRLNEGDYTVMDEIEIPGNKKVITVCAAGRTSQIAANILRENGIDAKSLRGGMKAWTFAWNTAQSAFENFNVVQIRRTGKGCLSYIVSSGKDAVIIDASLPAEVYIQLIKQSALSVKYVIETHIHADHLSRSKELAEHFNVPLLLPVPNKVQFSYSAILPDSTFTIGSVVLRTLSTPGHTLESVSFYIENSVVFSGDTLFTDGVGRPDLKASEDESRNKASLLFQSLKKLLQLPDTVRVFPAHTNKPVEFDRKMINASIGDIKNNISLLKSNENEFIEFLLQRIPEPPSNYLAIVDQNVSGNSGKGDAADLEAGANRCAIS